MSAIDIRESYTGCESGGSGRGKNRRLTATRPFSLVTDSPADRGIFTWPLTVGAVTIPAAGTPHPDNLNLISGIPAVVKKGPTLFDVKVPYESSDEYKDPLSEPANISWDDAEYTVTYGADLDGTAVVNVLGEPCPPEGLSKSQSDPVLVIERNEASFDPDVKIDYQDTVSTDVFWGAPAGRAKLGKIKARSAYVEQPDGTRTYYFQVRYEITFRMVTPGDVTDDKAWWRRILNQGLHYLDNVTDVKHETDNGAWTLLDPDGYCTAPDTLFFNYFREFPDESWSSLGIDHDDLFP